ncbi:hypothetical protein CHH83_02400 [Bacillus sp. 7586-K]|nr:hypothetical protein CHH83_02400 [Bacillus sp. 7586-K]
MMRVNKTKNNLELVWKQLDDASGSLYNALDNLSGMVNLEEDILRQADMIDVSRIDTLKEKIEALINNKNLEG